MDQDTFKRKLTTVFSVDAVGYSKLMGDDEAATVKTITAYRKIMAGFVVQHGGRVIDSPGDNLLAEFGSVIDAVQCAVAIQKELQTRNDELPENRRMLFRIGINLGDVIEKDGKIYGDGVNIAARTEPLADPGGICISRSVYDQVKNKVERTRGVSHLIAGLPAIKEASHAPRCGILWVWSAPRGAFCAADAALPDRRSGSGMTNSSRQRASARRPSASSFEIPFFSVARAFSRSFAAPRARSASPPPRPWP